MALEAEVMQRIYVQVALGTAKDQYPYPLSEEESAFWDQTALEVRAALEQGDMLDVPEPEVPDLPPWVQEAPEATTSPAEPSGGETASAVPVIYRFRSSPGGTLTDASIDEWDGVSYCCEEGCRSPATRHRPVDGGIVELVCESHAPAGATVVASAVSTEAIMPFGIRAGGPGCPHQVYNKQTGKAVPGGCHASMADAQAHLGALKSNVEDAAMTDTATPAVAAEALEAQPGEHFHAVMHRQGVSTGRRTFTNLEWREPPFAFHWQKGSSAHGGTPITVQVGLVARVVEDGEDLHSFGPLDLNGADGYEYARQLAAGFQRWVSIGLDEHKPTSVEIIWPEVDGEEVSPEDAAKGGTPVQLQEPDQVVIDGGVIGELTGTSIPAQADAMIEPTAELVQFLEARDAAFVPGQITQAADEAPGDQEGCPPGQHRDPDSGECVPDEPGAEGQAKARGLTISLGGGQVKVSEASAELGELFEADGELFIAQGVSEASPAERKKMLSKGERFPMHNCTDVGKAVRAVGRSAGGEPGRNQVRKHIIGKARQLGCSVPDNWNSDGTLKASSDEGAEFADTIEAITAAAYRIEVPDLPPAWWFEEPTDVEIPGAFNVTDEGRIYGILAPLHTNHRAFAGAGRRMTVPHGNVDYSRFLGGEALTATGRISGVGPITMDCRHASRFRDNHKVASDHYENSCTVFGKARVGETAAGLPWIAGALEPSVTPEQLSRALVCRLSGDWQPHPDRAGWSELVACLLVPSPGFPMARTGPSATFSDGVLVASSMPVQHIAEPVILDPDERLAAYEAATSAAGSDDWGVLARQVNKMGIRI